MIAPLPVTVLPDDRESATGYFLRSFAANRLSPRQVFGWQRIPWTDRLRHEHLPILSEVTGAPLAWLRPRVPQRVMDERWMLTWLGARWRSPKVLRLIRLQVCPQCVHADGLARLEWDLGCVCVCLRHQVLLTDRCAHCEGAIRWQRPAVDVCHCKRHLRNLNPPITIDFAVASWMQWIGDSLHDRQGVVPLPAALQPLFPGAPSIDGVWRIIWAYGVRPHSVDEALAGQTSGATPAQVLEVTQRGLARLRRAMEGELDVKEVHLSLLRAQQVRGVIEADRELARHLLRCLTGGGRMVRAQSGQQLDFFT